MIARISPSVLRLPAFAANKVESTAPAQVDRLERGTVNKEKAIKWGSAVGGAALGAGLVGLGTSSLTGTGAAVASSVAGALVGGVGGAVVLGYTLGVLAYHFLGDNSDNRPLAFFAGMMAGGAVGAAGGIIGGAIVGAHLGACAGPLGAAAGLVAGGIGGYIAGRHMANRQTPPA